MKKLLIFILLFSLTSPCSWAKTPEFEKYIEEAFESGIILGDENGDFHSEKIATRAEFATIVVRYLGLSGGVNIFSDVKDSDWFAYSLAAASFHGMLAGYENGQARPYDPITCEDAVTILGRYYDARSTPSDKTADVSDYAKGYFAYALEYELFQHEEYAEPKHFITKGEILALMYEYSRQDDKKIHFIKGYPRVSQNGVFNNISLDLMTNAPCTVYYSIKETGASGYSADNVLCQIAEGNTEGSVHLPANINKSYDIYLRAVDSDGVSGKTKVIKNIRPFPFSSGSGTPDAPYIIYSADQLAGISQNPDKSYRLGNDITVSGLWTPIENFSGVLDGGGYSISGISINSEHTDAGLFAELDGGTVKNLTVDADISAKMNTGIIAGRSENGSIESCTVTGTVSSKTNNAGGICGINRGTITNCLSAVYSVISDSYAGGICGQNFGKIENCLSAAETVVSQMCAGGISGTNTSGTITSCVAANMTVYNSMTYNSGKITINKQDGSTYNNYSYDKMITNASYEEQSEYSQSGLEISWDKLTDLSFYQGIGWSKKKWTMAENGYRLAVPSASSPPILEKGLTAYMPAPVSTPEELAYIDKNEAGHYIITKDIILKSSWKTICTQNGFSGTLDGNGHTVYNLTLKDELGMFSNITGGTIKNLTLSNVQASPSSSGAILTACNYGYIQNCSISGKLQTKKAGFSGTVVGENHGEISSCTVRAEIINNYDNSSTGGICGENNGVVKNCSFSGKMLSSGKNVVFGGIAGYSTNGYVSECFSDAVISLDSNSAYAGGICGISSGSQIYKCFSDGSTAAEGNFVYAGGICGAAEQSVVYNCFSASELYITATSAYTGGVCGFNEESNLQNTYSCGSIVSVGTGEIYTGGVCGYTENGFVMQNVSLNPSINSSGTIGAVIGAYTGSEISDNYSCERSLINSAHFSSKENNGTVKPLNVLKSADFYFKPVAQGGLLGWESTEYGESVWTTVKNRYPFPVLYGVNGNDILKVPVYK